jgi:acetyl-CoA carboxylase carboxyltransferase component
MSVDAADSVALARLAGGVAKVEVRAVDTGVTVRRVVWLEIDTSAPPTRLGSDTSARLEVAARVARAERVPLVGVLSTLGADIVEGVDALHGWGRAAAALTACSGIVPTILIVDGPAVSGPAFLLGLADLVVATERGQAFVNGPVTVAEYTGVTVDSDELGGSAALARVSGVATAVVADVDAARTLVEELLAYLPDHVDDLPRRWAVDDPPERPCPEAGDLIPSSSTGSYDVRQVVAAITDDDSVVELRERWAGNVVTAFATFAGRPVGVVANQPMILAGTLDIPASQKAARFVAMCDAFNLPIVTLVDTPGFYPGKDLEWRGMIRHGAQLVYAYARATVPRLCVILRKSYGGAYIVMDSKTMGNDLCVAWPWAEIAVMGAGQAAAILARRAAPEERAAFEEDYARRLLNPYVAAERGYLDAVIDPADTRRLITSALGALDDKRERIVERAHGNTPL